ncbi:MAG TPA: FAD-binding oxidoreductase [Acidobacteriota bacterium]|jgi:ferredoxin--NADP+ reductase
MALEALKAKMKLATLVDRVDVGGPWLSIFKFDLPEEFRFESGQYATLALDTPKGFLPRPYSIASSPYDSKILEFYINVVEEGEFTPHLFRLKVGDHAWYMGPKGKFTLGRTNKKNLIMVSTGTGLAPFVSMIRKLQRDGTINGKSDYRLVVMHGVSHSIDLGYRPQLEEWGRNKDLGVYYIPTVSRPGEDPDFQPQFAQGRVNDLLRHFLGEPKTGSVDPRPGKGMDAEKVKELVEESSAFYLCGNPGMIADAKEVLSAHGHTEIFTEDYW